MRRVDQAAAFLLHQRPWGDSGRILEFFSRDHGRLSVFAHGVRGASAKLAGVLQPFLPLLVSWSGRGESPRLTGAEFEPAGNVVVAMPQDRLLSAWYVTELVMSLTIRHDPQPEIYQHYRVVIQELRAGEHHSRSLRLFEKRLLDVLGYGVSDVDESQLEDPKVLERAKVRLRHALAACLEGRSLRTRVVAQSLRDFGRSARPAE